MSSVTFTRRCVARAVARVSARTAVNIVRTNFIAFSQATASGSKSVLDGAQKQSVRDFSSGDELVLMEKCGEKKVALLTLNRPKALNALNDALVKELMQKLTELDNDPSIHAIVLTGSEKAFAAGADIKEMDSKSFAEVANTDMLAHWNNIKQIRKPIIAAVNGFALGGGCELAMMCDIILAGDSAQFGQPEVLLGTIPGCGGTQRLTAAVGKSKAMNWILTGERFSADEAEKAGLVAKVLPAGELVSSAVATATKIASFSNPVINMAKECVNQASNMSLDQGLLFERRVFHSTWGFEDRKEGMNAFTAKRKASFQNK